MHFHSTLVMGSERYADRARDASSSASAASNRDLSSGFPFNSNHLGSSSTARWGSAPVTGSQGIQASLSLSASSRTFGRTAASLLRPRDTGQTKTRRDVHFWHSVLILPSNIEPKIAPKLHLSLNTLNSTRSATYIDLGGLPDLKKDRGIGISPYSRVAVCPIRDT